MEHIEGSNETFDDELRALVMSHKNDELKSIFKGLTPSRLVDNEGMTLLHLSARYGNLGMIEFSLAAGCDVTAKNSSEATPLHLAILHDEFAAAKLLLNARIDVLAMTDSEGKSTLAQLLTEKKGVPVDFIVHFFEKLKANCIDVDEVAEILFRAGCSLVYALLYVKDAEIVRALLQRKGWICQDESSDALRHVVDSVDLENLRVLLHYGPRAAKRKRDFFKDLYRAIASDDSAEWPSVGPIVGDLTKWQVDEAYLQFLQNVFEKKPKRVVQMFLQCGVDAHAKSHSGQDLLAHLFGNPHGDVIDLLKDRRFDVNARGRGGMSALHVAVMNGLEGNVKFLLSMGADPNATDDRGRTPLLCSNAWLSQPIAEHLLVVDGASEGECIAELLLRHGADIQVVDDGERTVLEVFYYLSSMQPILARLAVAEAQGTAISRLIRDRIQLKDGYKDFYDDCLLQIDDMKRYKIARSVTLLAAVTEKAENIDVRQRRAIDEALDYCDKCNFHRVYTAPLRVKLEKALKIYESRCRAAVVIAECLDMLIGPDHLVTEKIVSFLSYEDLLVFQ